MGFFHTNDTILHPLSHTIIHEIPYPGVYRCYRFYPKWMGNKREDIKKQAMEQSHGLL